MRSFKYILFLAVIALIVAASSCTPEYITKSGAGGPDSTKLSFTVTPVPGNNFKFVLKNTSSIVGIANFNDGNGNPAKDGDTIVYNLHGTYKITMALYTQGGSASLSQSFTQTVDNWALLLSDKIKMLFGNVNDVNGKSWVIDSITPGHFGVGPGPGGYDPAVPMVTTPADAKGFCPWWTAAPGDKKGRGCYDDVLNFSFVNNTFICSYNNHGNCFGIGDVSKPALRNYTNLVADGGDWEYNCQAPLTGSWAISTKGVSTYITFKTPSALNPIYPMYDIVSPDNTYKIVYIDANHLVLVGLDSGGLLRLFMLRQKGYTDPIPPVPSFTVSATATATANTFNIGLANIVHPTAKATIASVTYDFGDGAPTVTTTKETDIESHQYKIKGIYTVTATVTSGLGDIITQTTSVTVAANASGYTPYLLNEMVMYNNFGDMQLVPIGFDKSDGDGSATTVANPDASKYPNRSGFVCKYTKINAQWANAFMKLPNGLRFTLTQQHLFKILVYGKKGDEVLLKLENTDMGGNAWQTGVEAKRYVIQNDNTWEEASYEFSGVANAGAAAPAVSDVVADARTNAYYYNVIRIMYKPGIKDNYTFYFDDLAGPHVESLK